MLPVGLAALAHLKEAGRLNKIPGSNNKGLIL